MPSGLLDTSVVIDLDDPDVLSALPDESAICTVTMAELAAGPHLATDTVERAKRQARLQQVEATFDPIPLDAAAARSFGQLVAEIAGSGRSHRKRFADLAIAAVAHSQGLALFTRNASDFDGLDRLLSIVPI